MEIFNKESPSDCVFCEIAKWKDIRLVIASTDKSTAFISLEGHPLVVPKKHIEESNYDTGLSDMVDAYSLAYSLVNIVKHVYGVGGVTLLQNFGYDAGQEINHFHIHLVPRIKGDKLIVARMQLTSELARETNVARLRDALSHST